MNWQIFSETAQHYGVAIALVGFFIWRDWKREVSMASTIRDLEKEMRDLLKEMVSKTTEALTNNTTAMHTICEQLLKRPCVAEELAKELVKQKP